jgi:hypothetical protein
MGLYAPTLVGAGMHLIVLQSLGAPKWVLIIILRSRLCGTLTRRGILCIVWMRRGDSLEGHEGTRWKEGVGGVWRLTEPEYHFLFSHLLLSLLSPATCGMQGFSRWFEP